MHAVLMILALWFLFTAGVCYVTGNILYTVRLVLALILAFFAF